MGFGSLGEWGSEKLSSLMNYINQDGSIMEGMTSEFTAVAGDLNTLYKDSTISISENGHVEVDGVSYDSLDDFQTQYIEKANKQTVSEYFGDYSYYCGVITNENSSAENFIKAICAATDCDMTYGNDGTLYSATPKSGGRFVVLAQAATNETQAKVILQGASYPGFVAPTFELMKNLTTSNGLYLKYFVYRGSEGDCYAKFYYTNDATLPDMNEAEVYFEDIGINAYYTAKTYVDDEPVYQLEHQAVNYGGFALLLFEQKVGGKSEYFDVVLFGTSGAPIVVGISADSLETLDETNVGFYRAITNNDTLSATVAPIYSPYSEPYVAKNSYWGIISIKDGYYKTNVGSYLGVSYVYDHGLLLEA